MSRFFKRPMNFNDDDVRFLTSLGYDKEYARFLNSRGITKQNSREYFDDTYFFTHDPFKMTNMSKVVETIKKAVDDGKSFLIYGDYDADGLTASAILKLFFDHNGVESRVVIPTRDDGYGLHVDLVVNEYVKQTFDLLITVDCGISNVEEIGEIKRQLTDIDIIVTDHHELPPILPDCLCINCKMGYPFAYLSGAGVALKLVEALSDTKTALLYSDLASIGTIADMMPMEDENRQIIKYGLKNVRHRGLLKLAEATRCDKELNASTAAMKLCPKINSAGRVGYPLKALKLLLMEDRATESAVKDLIDCNTLRQNLLEALMEKAALQVQKVDFSKEKMLFFVGDDWQKGILGIGANRFKELHKMPVAFLTKDGENYVGSARGVEELNLFELFSSVSDLLVRFGGHKGSVGFTVRKDNLAALKEEINKKLSDFAGNVQYSYYDLEFSSEWLDKVNFEKLSCLEPYLPNEKPVFYIHDYCVTAGTFGNGNLKFTLSCGIEIKSFGNEFIPYLRALKYGAECDVSFCLERDKYTDKIFGSLVDIDLTNSLKFDELYACNFLQRVVTENVDRKRIDVDTAKQLLMQANVLAVFNTYLDYEKALKTFDLSDFGVNFFFQRNFKEKGVLISPDKTSVFKNYRTVIVFGRYGNYMQDFGENVFYVDVDFGELTCLTGINIDRKVCGEVYNSLSVCQASKKDLHTFFDNQFFYCDRRQFFACIAVLKELKLVRVEDEKIVEICREKKNLADSFLYKRFSLK